VDANTMLGRDFVTSPAIYCFDDQEIKEAAQLMHNNQIRRLVILNRGDMHLVGVVSLSDLALHVDNKLTGKVLQSVFQPVN
jgi:CBS domain-containing protein